jgi:BMFP domain-containing protein YqiC
MRRQTNARAEDPAMLDPKHLDDLTARLAGSLPKGLQVLQEDISRNLRAALEAGLGRLDLVTREEFDVQAAVLARTREKLDRLEAEVARLEGGRRETPAKPPKG